MTAQQPREASNATSPVSSGGGGETEAQGPAQELRQAAALLRESEIIAIEVNDPDGGKVRTLWPVAAEPLAALLEKEAASLERHLPHWGSHPGGIDEPAIIRTPEDTAALVRHHFGHALDVATALLSRDTGKATP